MTPIRLQLVQDELVSVWIIRAIGPGEILEDDGDLADDDSRSMRGFRTLLTQHRLPSGQHQLVWDGRDDHHHEVPDGAYRVYVLVGDVVLYSDLVCYRTCAPLWAPVTVTRNGERCLD